MTGETGISNASAFSRTAAWLPLLLSAAALGTVLVHIALHGARREPDEGTAAHVFQLLLAAELPIIAFFAIKWLPRAPRQAARVLTAQALGIAVALAPVWYFNL